jgi:hypothetical protein
MCGVTILGSRKRPTRSCTKIQNSSCVLRTANDVFLNDPWTRRHVLRSMTLVFAWPLYVLLDVQTRVWTLRPVNSRHMRTETSSQNLSGRPGYDPTGTRNSDGLLHTFAWTTSTLGTKDPFSRNLQPWSWPTTFAPTLASSPPRAPIRYFRCPMDGDKYRTVSTAGGKGTRPRRGQCRNTCVTARSV